MMKKYIRIVILFTTTLLMLLLCSNNAVSQENEWNSWTSVELSKDINKRLSLYFSPEVRFTNEFKVDEYFIETGLEYKLFKFLDVGGNYRFLINERETKSTEYFGRVALDLKSNYDFKRLGFQIRTRYCTYNEFNTEEDSNDPYLRYRFKMKYDISKTKITPYISMEFFHQLNEKEINKIRKTIGFDYKVNKKNKLGLQYLVQDYHGEDYRKNIISLEYNIAF